MTATSRFTPTATGLRSRATSSGSAASHQALSQPADGHQRTTIPGRSGDRGPITRGENMNQTHTHSNVLIAVDAEIGVLERRLAKPHDIRRLAAELDEARLPAAAAPQLPATTPGARPRKSKRQSPRLEIHRDPRRRPRHAGRRFRDNRGNSESGRPAPHPPCRARDGGGARAARRRYTNA